MNKAEKKMVDDLNKKILHLTQDVEDLREERINMIAVESQQSILLSRQNDKIKGLEVGERERQGALNFVNCIIYNDYPEDFSGNGLGLKPSGTQKILLNIRSILVGDFIL